MNLIRWIVILIVSVGFASAQDLQLSQYYNAPLYLNPAFTGTSKFLRTGLNYRIQWPGLSEPFRSFSVWADYTIGETNSAVGLLIKRDAQGVAKLTSTDIAMLYAHRIKLNRRWLLKPGLQTSFVHRSLDFSKSLFSDQITNSGATGTPSADPLANAGNSFSYLDLSSGALLYDKITWAGISFHHINRPNQAMSDNIQSPLPVKWSIHAGYKFIIESGIPHRGSTRKNTSITPTFNYKLQGKFDQLDVGLYAIYDPLMIGVWYRGLPVKNYRIGAKNNESFILLLGIRHENISFGYSYDFTVSSLAGNSKGAHEFSITYYFKAIKNFFNDEDDIPCPDLDIQYKKLDAK